MPLPKWPAYNAYFYRLLVLLLQIFDINHHHLKHHSCRKSDTLYDQIPPFDRSVGKDGSGIGRMLDFNDFIFAGKQHGMFTDDRTASYRGDSDFFMGSSG